MHQTCDKLLECCGVSFSTKASLREHIMIFHHNGYSCPYCGRRFCRKALLKRHLSVHSGQKDYTCPSCDYATSHKSNLERHKRIHERLKLGEDGSIFGCADFSGHQVSPDTTDNSFNEADSKSDNCVDIDTSDDSSSDIDVTEDSFDEDNKLLNYPIYIPKQQPCNASVSTLLKAHYPYSENSSGRPDAGRQNVDLCINPQTDGKRKIETVTKSFMDPEACEPLDLQVTQSTNVQ